MRDLNEIENELALARKESEMVTGTQAEVYSRIVGYYRSVRNWNKGKREEYGERKLFDVAACEETACADEAPAASVASDYSKESLFSVIQPEKNAAVSEDARLLLFVRPQCPACPGAKTAAGKLGIPIETVNADTEDGLEEAKKLNVFSTPTAILMTSDGKELRRARDAAAIANLLEAVA